MYDCRFLVCPSEGHVVDICRTTWRKKRKEERATWVMECGTLSGWSEPFRLKFNSNATFTYRMLVSIHVSLSC